MKINNSLYFDIEVQKIGESGRISNFLRFDDLIFFKLTEFAGATGIMTECSFRTNNRDIRNLFVQNNRVYFKLGESDKNVDTISVDITEVNYSESGEEDLDTVSFAGVLSVGFIFDRKSKSYTGMSLNVIEDLHAEYFLESKTIIDSNVIPSEYTKANKPMIWIRDYKKGNMFMQDVWLHMDLGDKKCPIIAIDRHSNLLIKEVNNELKFGEVKYNFTTNPKKDNDIRYLNRFVLNSYKFDTNMFLDYGAFLHIKDIDEGKDYATMVQNNPDLASTSVAELNNKSGFRQIFNKPISRNVHKNYVKCFYRNLSRLIRLSSIGGNVICAGYYPNVNILDVVNVDSHDDASKGKYIINTKTTTFGYNRPITTVFYVSRDNRNNIENYTGKVFNIIQKVFNQEISNLLQATRNLKRLVIMCSQVMDGTFLEDVIAYTNRFKYDLLTSFSLFGTTLDFNSMESLLETLKLSGNSFCNQIINAFIPYPYNFVFKDYAIQKPSMKTLLSKLLNRMGPNRELNGLLVEITELFTELTEKTSRLEQTVQSSIQSNRTLETDMSLLTDQEKIQAITDEFIANTDGADIPIPQVDLTESEGLLPMDDLRDLMANKTVIKLREKGYLWGIDNFREILLGEEPMDFNTISKINENIGNMLYARYWGTFKDPSELTDFFVKNAFKDIYVTVPTTKIINALRGSRVFMALPKLEENLTFYINNKEVEMEVLEDLNLGLYTISGYPLLYNVYMSKGTFNSNNTILEVRKGRV